MCGIIAVAGHIAAPQIARLGLHNLQHRGQEAAGMAIIHNGKIQITRGRGKVSDVIGGEFLKLSSSYAIGHVRYSTEGGPSGSNSQPLYAKLKNCEVAIAHNGHIANYPELRSWLEEKGAIFQTSTDTEVILHLMAQTHGPVKKILEEALLKVKGSYCLVLLANNNIYIARDENGIRPLCFGTLGNSVIVASESCAIESLNGTVVGEVAAGTVESIRRLSENIKPRRICVFEYIYFARPDSTIEDISVYNAREAHGRRLSEEQPAEADVCVGVPDSGVEAAIGYSQDSGIPYARGILRSHYSNRTFICPEQSLRVEGVRLKLFPVRRVIDGKRVVVIDDSIVRSNTAKHIVKMLKDFGALEVHFRVASAPIIFPCYYGIDLKHMEEMVAATHSIEEIRKVIGADSLGYLSHQGMVESLGLKSFCSACFTGEYPI